MNRLQGKPGANKIEAGKLCALAGPFLAAFDAIPERWGREGKKSSIINAIAARMFGFFHPHATYSPLPEDLAAGSERLHAEASADVAFAPHPRDTKHQKHEPALIQREERRCLALISMPSTTKLILGNQPYILREEPHCRGPQVDGVSDGRLRAPVPWGI
ncbi:MULTISPECIES: hypothetical protein [unclassified Rhizobium]|uniref:hypothetical protein n=1 Tax=unclassified Rhizobium TaxID=2613769 RepID=UPI0007E9AF51|nr:MULTISPECIES: hypothetical protein [unclassified Rhizobium]